MRLQPTPPGPPAARPPASSETGPSAAEQGTSFEAVLSDLSKDSAGGDGTGMRLVHPAVPDASFPVPAAPPVGSPLFVAGGNLSADMAQMLNQGWSPAALLPSHAYSEADSDYKSGFGVDGTLSGYQQRMIDAGIMRQSGPGQTMSVNSTGPGVKFYPEATQPPASATSTPTASRAASDAIPPAAVNDPGPSTPMALAPKAAAPAPEAAPAAKAVVRMTGEAPVAAPRAGVAAPAGNAPAPVLPDEASIEASLIDEMLRGLAQSTIAARDNLALPTG